MTKGRSWGRGKSLNGRHPGSGAEGGQFPTRVFIEQDEIRKGSNAKRRRTPEKLIAQVRQKTLTAEERKGIAEERSGVRLRHVGV